MNLGEQLRCLRHRAGLDLHELESRSGVSARTVAQWELGHREPTLSLLGYVLTTYALELYPESTSEEALRALLLEALGLPITGARS